MLRTVFSRMSSLFSISPAAAQKVNHLLQDNLDNKMMRISLRDGGNAGFAYEFEFVPSAVSGDQVFTENGATVALDQKSLTYLGGGTLEFFDDKFTSAFKIILPEDPDDHSCACGKSSGKKRGGCCGH